MLGRAGAGVAHADEFHGSKDGGEGSGAQPAMRVEHRAVCLFGVATQAPHLHCRDAASGPGGAGVGPRGLWPAAGTRSGGEGVGGRWRMPARTPAERTQQRRVWYRQGNKLRLPCSYGNITVRTMSRVSVSKSGVRPDARNAPLERHTQRFLELRRGLEQFEYFCKGTVLKRMMKCGKAQCACASDATKRHGPYFEITYKANGKTVNVKLSPEAAPLYQGRRAAISQVENPAQPPRQTLQNHPAAPSQTGRIQAPGLTAKTGVIPISPV